MVPRNTINTRLLLFVIKAELYKYPAGIVSSKARNELRKRESRAARKHSADFLPYRTVRTDENKLAIYYVDSGLSFDASSEEVYGGEDLALAAGEQGGTVHISSIFVVFGCRKQRPTRFHLDGCVLSSCLWFLTLTLFYALSDGK